jgi:hypothetical protein
MSTEAPKAPEIPGNPLCSSEHPSDVISAARCALYFLHTAQTLPDPLSLKACEDWAEGREYLWGAVDDALRYAGEQLEAQVKP